MIESVIAMFLVAVIVGGIFSVLMASRRAIIEPTYKEDMIYAVESVKNMLKTNIAGSSTTAYLEGVGTDPCGMSAPLIQGTRLLTGTSCVFPGTLPAVPLMPDVCTGTSTFRYWITNEFTQDDLTSGSDPMPLKRLHIRIDCQRDIL